MLNILIILGLKNCKAGRIVIEIADGHLQITASKVVALIILKQIGLNVEH